MVTMDQARAEMQRTGIWLLEVYVDRCTLENGIAPCTASNPCHFTWTTCEDIANYTKGSRIYKFCSRGARVSGALSLLNDVNLTFLPTKIDSRRFTAEKGEMRFDIYNDDPLIFSDPEKSTTQVENLSYPGRFLERMLARSPNLRGRIVKLFRGFTSVPIANWELKYIGRIEDLTWNEEGLEIRAVDMLYKLVERKTPTKISSTNVLQTSYSGGSTMNVYDVSEFADADVNNPKAVKLESEYVQYTGKNVGSNQLTGCTPGAFATTAVSHVAGTKVGQVLVYGDISYNGIEGDHILMDLLCNYGNVPPEYIDYVDRGIILAAALGAGATSAILSDSSSLSDVGIVKIDNEWIWYGANDVSTNTISSLKRGMYQTSDVAHLINTSVYLNKFTDQLTGWFYRPLFRTKIESPQTVKAIIQNFQESAMFDVWQNELSFITCQLQAPALPGSGVVPPTYTLTNMEYNSRDIDRNEDGRFTRISIYYNASKAWPGKDPENYDGLALDVGANEENSNYYDEVKEKVVYSNFLYRESDALWLAIHMLSKYRYENPIIDYLMEIYNEAIKTGDLVYLQIPEIVLPNGDYDTRLYRITWKKAIGAGSIEYKAHDTGFGTNRYSLIGPPNPVLDQPMTNVQVTMDVDLSGTGLTINDFRQDATHALTILDLTTSTEVITYTGITDLGGGVLRFTGLTRDADGALGGGVAHAAGEVVLLMYSAMVTAFIDRYGFQGDYPNNLLDDDADFVDTVPGYKIW